MPLLGKTFALVDCNNFFVSCERLFRPDLRRHPVVVLSNNDGCVISRSNEVKALGIKMGEPFFKIAHLVKQYNIAVFSSNFSLYLDISNRVTSTLETFTPYLENYSVDESFLDLSGMQNVYDYGHKIKAITTRNTGIPVCVGIAPSKTLAKVANYGAKKNLVLGGVLSLDREDERIWLLQNTPLEEVWGIGRRYYEKLSHDLGLKTAYDLACQDHNYIKQKYNIVLAKIVQELNGISCFELEDTPKPQKQMMRSRTFGEKVIGIRPLYEILAQFTSTLGEKLRLEKQYTLTIGIFIKTNPFSKEDSQYSNSISYTFSKPVDDTITLLDTVKVLLKRIYKPYYKYYKAGVILDNLTKDPSYQTDLFENDNFEISEKRKKLMKVIDAINASKPNTIFLAAQGVNTKSISSQKNLSPQYTTKWKDVPKVY
jgi:DNA polymerase V